MNAVAFGLAACLAACPMIAMMGCAASPPQQPAKPRSKVALGNFSVSLAVKDLAASRAFYEKLGLVAVAGDEKHYIIMQNQDGTIGLFQGLFPRNILTFNPGWDRDCNTLPQFTDVRDLQRLCDEKGIIPVSRADEKTDGPAGFMIVDPDGNQILIDQHVPKGK